eukprot:5330002-Alexandrium_andersonii.AAC.1
MLTLRGRPWSTSCALPGWLQSAGPPSCNRAAMLPRRRLVLGLGRPGGWSEGASPCQAAATESLW